MTTADALRMANNMNDLPRENTTVAGMNQAKATGPQTEMQAGFAEQARSNMGGPMGSPKITEDCSRGLRISCLGMDSLVVRNGRGSPKEAGPTQR